MPRNSSHPLHIGHALRWDALPLGDSLRADLIPKRTGKAAGAVYGLFCLSQGNRGRVGYWFQIAHATLKAQLSSNCKYIFR
jgi:hypothetical protein